MIFNSTYEPNVKRAMVRHDIGYIAINDYETNVFVDLEKIAAKSKVDKSKIKYYKKTEQIDEYGHTEDRLNFYYEIEETDTEYFNRIEKLQLKDIQDCAQALSTFIYLVAEKEKVQELYNKFKHKRQLADWQKEQLETFLSSVSTEEKVDKSYKKGYSDGRKQVDELKKKIKELS